MPPRQIPGYAYVSSPWLDDDDAIVVHSRRYAAGNHDTTVLLTRHYVTSYASIV